VILKFDINYVQFYTLDFYAKLPSSVIYVNLIDFNTDYITNYQELVEYIDNHRKDFVKDKPLWTATTKDIIKHMRINSTLYRAFSQEETEFNRWFSAILATKEEGILFDNPFNLIFNY